MTLLVAWVVFPLVLGLLALGCGLLLERVAGWSLPGPVLLPSGLAVIVVAAGLATTTDATAKLATPIVVGLAVAGLALSLPPHGRPIDRWALAAAVAVFAVFAAPVVLSGQATFAGYIKLDDTSTWLAMTDRVMEHGRDLAGLPPSSYEATLNDYLAAGTPVGANLPLGAGAKIVGLDVAWVFQPYLAFLAAMLALSLYELVTRLALSRPLRAFVVFVAAQPAILYAYSLWGAMKELAAAAIIALAAALTVPLLRARHRIRSLVPVAVASAALLAVLSVGGAVWLGPLAAAVLVTAIRLRAFVLRAATGFAVFALALSVPSFVAAGSFLHRTSSTHVFTSSTELGNLIHPLSRLQIFGIWPAGDFRTGPTDRSPTYVLIAIVASAAAGGLVWAWRRRAWELIVYVWTLVVGCAIVTSVGSPWVGGKALATASPAFVLLALGGAAAIFQRGRRIEATVLAAAIAGGVLWSNALAYHAVWLAPRSQLAELEQIGKRFAGQGPTLMTEYQPYGVRHFLRGLDPEGASELRRRAVLLRRGGMLQKGAYADIDDFQLDGLLVYRTLVLDRSPVASRPPSVYRLVWSGRYYEVWQRPEAPEVRILAHLPLGNRTQAVATPACSDILRLARTAGADRLAAVMRAPATVLDLGEGADPAIWQVYGPDPVFVVPLRSGTLERSVSVTAAGRYRIWLGGSFRGRVEATVDGRRVGAVRDRLEHLGQFIPMGDVPLRPGTHVVALRYVAGGLRPGSGGTPFPLGPLVVSRTTANVPITYVRLADARALCGKSLDWVEALGS